jgi:hypothetical protein
MFSSSSLPRLLLSYAGGNSADLASFDPDDREAMLRFFIRHGYLQADGPAVRRMIEERATPLAAAQLKLTSKGAWLLGQLRSRGGSMPLFQPA